MGRIGVAISTHKRPELLARALSSWAKFMPDFLVVVHDVNGAGVAATKNRCLELLMADAGCEDLFLSDDDCWPVTEYWHRPYVENSQPALMHCWGKSRYLCTEGDTTVWSWPRGAVLYVERRVVEKVGGMRTEFGRWGGEHAEWSQRIFNAGFTRAPFADAKAARHGIWHCEDYLRAVPSSVPKSVRDDPVLAARRHALRKKYLNSTEFVPYR